MPFLFQLQLAPGEIMDQRKIGFEEIVTGQILRLGPLHILEDAILQFSLILPHDVEAQLHRAAAFVLVPDARDLFADHGFNAEFFLEFAAKRVSRLFAFLNLASGKLPLQRHGLVARALAHEDLAVSDDEACHDLLHWDDTVSEAWTRAGSMQLVKVKAKAASPGPQASSSVCSPKSCPSTSAYMRGCCTTTYASSEPLAGRKRVSTALRSRVSG